MAIKNSMRLGAFSLALTFLSVPIYSTEVRADEPHAWHVDTPAYFADAEQTNGERQLIFDMATYEYVQTDGVTNFNNSTYLSASGSPVITRANGSLQLTDRSENWHTIDVNLANLSLGSTYLFTATGTAEPGMQIGFHRSESPWNFVSNSMVNTADDGTWAIEGIIDYPINPFMPAMRIQTNNAETAEFNIETIRVYRISTADLVFESILEINTDNFSNYANYLIAGAQMEGTITSQGFRLENVTGDYTSGNGNYLRLNLPNPILPATNLRISWDVYVPSSENLGERVIVGPGLVINSNFGQAPSQPTNDIDLNREIQMDEWVTTSIEFMVSHEVGDVAEHLIFRFRVNEAERQPSVLYINNINIEYGGEADFVEPQWDLTLQSLAEAFEPFFTFGNIYPTHAIMNQFDTREAFLHHFNAVTAENWHKPDHLAGPAGLTTRPSAEDFNFDSADAIVNFAIENDLKLIGHAFVWHSQTPAWLFGAEGNRLTRQEARDNMEFYIRTLSEHFTSQGTINAFHSWDVVNEVIASGGGDWGADLEDWNGGDWRTQMRTNSGWWEAYSNNPNPQEGEHPSDFVYDAFVFARRYFPNSILYYNDYNEEIPAKRNAIAQMVEQLNERWAHDSENNPEAVPVGQLYNGRLLIEGIGLQSHFHYPMGGWSTNFNNIRPALERFAATGTILAITELDITMGAHGQGATAFQNLPEEYAQRQAEVFARLFEYYLEFADYIERVSIWGLADNQSWRAAGHPVLFDSYFNAKPAFFAILDTVNSWSGATPAVNISEEQELRQVRVSYGEATLTNIQTGAALNMGTEVISIENELFVPVRPIAEELGFIVEWEELTRTVSIYFNSNYEVSFYAQNVINNRALASIDLFTNLGVQVTIDGNVIEFIK
ncbi:MAG: endo-1,4-beta-xylanase [Defluviitaleaceae bacterium]|nr:endo-1,4-beta-xylanase [Defluviitaleaceae bacterium]